MAFIDTLIGRPNTIKTYRSLFDNHIQPALDRSDAARLVQPQLERMVGNWIEKDLSPATIRQLLILLLQYVAYAGGDPSSLDVKKLNKKLKRLRQEPKIKCFTQKQAKAFLDHLETTYHKPWRGPHNFDCDAKYYYLYALFGIHAGLRRGEIMGLQYQSLDALKNRIIVCRSFDGPTKNGKTREVPMSGRLITALADFDFMAQPPKREIFPLGLDGRFDIPSMCQKLGLPELSTHGFRHTFATLALESGKVSPRTVQGWLGHSQLSTTLNIYWQAIPADSRMEWTP